jgi:hypothetical protein
MTAPALTLATFITAHQLGFTVTPADANPNLAANEEWARTASHWRCVLKRHGRRLTVPFSQGEAYMEPPTLAEVLKCVASDSATYEYARSFSEWCHANGYDTDSRKAERTYRVIGRQAASLKSLLGEPAYQELLWNTERL